MSCQRCKEDVPLYNFVERPDTQNSNINLAHYETYYVSVSSCELLYAPACNQDFWERVDQSYFYQNRP
jgi:hypothetical protein